MCNVFGPPVFARPFQHYQVWKKRGATYVFGVDKVRQEFGVLRIPRKDDPAGELELLEGETRFPLQELESQQQELSRDGVMEKVATASGIVGFIRFLQGHYLILISKHKKVGKIGHHYVLSIEATTLVDLSAENTRQPRDEKAFVNHFGALNLSRGFYFSYSYELSRTAQQNLVDAARAASGDLRRPLYMERDPSKHHRFVWNHYHMSPFLEKEGWQHWCISIIHGFFAYTKCSSFGWTFEVALIARRSRFHAGTRYRKRGLNVDGQVANDVETEQLLCDDSTRHLAHGHVMSFVQVRGSVPLFWSQEATTLNPKPPVVYPRCDPTLSATRLHFADLMERYGTPQLVVNLMKAKKVDSYEVRLSKHFESAIERMNRELPPSVRILYRPLDMKNHAKSSPINDVFVRLAESVVSRVGFFHTYAGLRGGPERVQSGVVRTNCVDCLDRTNVLQFFVGLEVLKQQLTALNLLPEPRLDFDSQVVFVLQELYDLMGDHLALQYAGSVAHKKYPLLGSRPRMMTGSRELLTSIHRHYNNSFNDCEKQAAMNLFLGIYRPTLHPRLWDLDCDSWVHHRALRDEYRPGEWWAGPLATCAEKLEVLRMARPAPGASLVLEDASGWFGVVHKTRKFTWFEKLLSRLEATFVQINASSRRLGTLRPFKAIAQLRQEQKTHVALSVRDTAFHPQPLCERDLRVYTDYIKNRKLRRMIWSHGSLVPLRVGSGQGGHQLAFADFTLARAGDVGGKMHEDDGRRLAAAATAEAAGPDFCDAEALCRLLGQRIFQQLCERPRPRSRPVPDKVEKSERDEAQRRLRAVSEAYEGLRAHGRHRDRSPDHTGTGDLAGPAVVLAAATADRGQDRSWSLQCPTSPRLPVRQLHVGPATSACRVRLCDYCGGASAGLVEHDPAREDAARWGPFGHLCPRHRRTALEVERFTRRGSLKAKPRRAMAPHASGHTCIAICSERARGQRPWEGWLRVESQQATQARAEAPSPRGRTAPPALRALPAAWGSDEPEPAVAGSDTESSRSPPDHGCDVQAAGIGGSMVEDESQQHLWSYVFPHMAPPAPQAEQLGLPCWWLEALDAPLPPMQEMATFLGVRNRGREQRARRRSIAGQTYLKSVIAPGLVPPRLEVSKVQNRRSIFCKDSLQALESILAEPSLVDVKPQKHRPLLA